MRRASCLALIILALVGLGLSAARADTLVFAAASLKNALDEADRASGILVKVSYGSSGALAKQIEHGAPADVFISADKQWMDYVQKRGLVLAPSDLLGNQLVLIAGKADARAIDIHAGFDLAGLLGADGRLAVGDPNSVPAGIYAKEALQNLGAWPSVASKLAPGADVRAALTLVSRGEAPLGIVYATDAKVDPGVRVAGVFPESSHKPIVYPVAQIKASTSPDAPRYLAFLTSARAKEIFEHYGFAVLAH